MVDSLGSVTVISKGSAIITATAKDSSKKEGTLKITEL